MADLTVADTLPPKPKQSVAPAPVEPAADDEKPASTAVQSPSLATVLAAAIGGNTPGASGGNDGLQTLGKVSVNAARATLKVWTAMQDHGLAGMAAQFISEQAQQMENFLKGSVLKPGDTLIWTGHPQHITFYGTDEKFHCETTDTRPWLSWNPS